jgi:signal transduction histidine kinase
LAPTSPTLIASTVATAQDVAAQALQRSIAAAEQERTRWAREQLHDETLQELAAL